MSQEVERPPSDPTAGARVEAPAGAERLHYIDWLKVLIVYGIFVYHVSIIFSFTPWLISNPQKSAVLSAFAGFCYPWGIPAMFLMAGADSWFSLRSHSARSYVRARVMRLLVPLVVGMALLTPLQHYLIATHPPPPISRLFGYYWRFFLHPTWDPLHLWFLGYLFGISMVALPVLLWLKTESAKRALAWLIRVVDGRPGIYALALPLVVSQLLLRQRYPENLSWADVATYSLVFLFGATLATGRGFEAAIRREIEWAIAIGFLSLAIVGLTIFIAPGHTPMGPQVPLPLEAAYDLAWSLDIWSWLIAVLYLGIRWLNFPNRVLAYFSESILPFYILHHPVVLLVATFVVPMDLGVWPKFAIVLTCALAATLFLYEFGVRRWTMTRILFGLRVRRSGPGGGRSAGSGPVSKQGIPPAPAS